MPQSRKIKKFAFWEVRVHMQMQRFQDHSEGGNAGKSKKSLLGKYVFMCKCKDFNIIAKAATMMLFDILGCILLHACRI